MHPDELPRDLVVFSEADDTPVTGVDPKPSHKTHPDWFKNLKPSAEGLQGIRNNSVKMCMPFTDALGIGWMLRAPETVTLESHSQTLPDGVTPVPDTDPVTQPNVELHTPEYLLDTGWDITTSDGVSLLFVPPMNHFEPRYSIVSYLADTDSDTTSLKIPVFTHTDSVTIEKGDLLAQAIPIIRDELLSPPTRIGYTDSHTFADVQKSLDDVSNARTSFYRKELWVNKPSSSILTTVNSVEDAAAHVANAQENDSDAELLYADSESEDFDSRSFIPDGASQAHYTQEKYLGMIPEAKPAGEYAPDTYFENMSRVLDPITDNPVSDWVEAAMQIGMMFPVPKETRFTRTDDGLEVSQPGTRNYHVMHSAKIGSGHPQAPFNPVNIIGQWTPVLPRGYSNLYTNPLNHYQTEFETFSGMVESDRHLSTVNIPGLLRDDAPDNVTIEQGMPVTQGIPINRETMITNAYINRE